MQKQIILASGSPRRCRILKEMGLNFRIVPSRVKEEPGSRFSLTRLKALALEKAKKVAKRFRNSIVIGADTVVVVRGKVYGKPKDVQDAKRILEELSGRTQYVWTAVAIVDIKNRKSIVRAARSKVVMKRLSSEEIEMLASKNLDKAGAYAVQEDDRFIESIEGSFTNVVGFPVEVLKEMLDKFKIFEGAER